MAASVMPAARAMSRTLVRGNPFSEKSRSEASRICFLVAGPRRARRVPLARGPAGTVVTSSSPPPTSPERRTHVCLSPKPTRPCAPCQTDCLPAILLTLLICHHAPATLSTKRDVEEASDYVSTEGQDVGAPVPAHRTGPEGPLRRHRPRPPLGAPE